MKCAKDTAVEGLRGILCFPRQKGICLGRPLFADPLDVALFVGGETVLVGLAVFKGHSHCTRDT